MVTPLLGVGLFTPLGGGAVAVLDAVTFAIAVVSLLLIDAPETVVARTGQEPWRVQVTAGFRHIRRTTVLRQTTIAAAFVLLVVGLIESVMFALVAQGLHRSPSFLGVLITVQGVGAIAGGLTAARAMRRWGEPIVNGVSMIGLAVGVGLWIVPVIPVVSAGSIVFGFALPWLVVGTSTLVQRRTPPALQGRVFSAFDTAVSVPQTLSVALGAALITVVPYTVLLAAITVVSAAAGAWLITRPPELPTTAVHPARHGLVTDR